MENKTKLRVLRTRSDFEALKLKGFRKSPSPWVTFYALKNSTEFHQLGFTISRKVGSAVVRNRLRRWGREFFRSLLKKNHQPDVGLNINVIFRPMDSKFYSNLKHPEFDEVFDRGFSSLSRRFELDRSSHD